MKFYMKAIGGGEFRQEIPVELWQEFTMIGMLYKEGRTLITHATMRDVKELAEQANPSRIGINSEDQFTINGNAWTQRAEYKGNSWASAWVCWYKGHADTPFFMPRDFPNDPAYFGFDKFDQGVWENRNGNMIFKGICQNETEFEEIIKEFG